MYNITVYEPIQMFDISLAACPFLINGDVPFQEYNK